MVRDVRVGFTGTRNGLTPVQRSRLSAVLMDLNPDGGAELHHGDCVGADEAVDSFARLDMVPWRRHIHPSDLADQRAWCPQAGAVVHPTDKPLVRNRAIVRNCTVLVACPGEQMERRRSGTWATVRAARKAGKPVVIVWPDGTVTKENR